MNKKRIKNGVETRGKPPGASLPDVVTLERIWRALHGDFVAGISREDKGVTTGEHLCYRLDGPLKDRVKRYGDVRPEGYLEISKTRCSQLISRKGSMGSLLRILLIAAHYQLSVRELQAIASGLPYTQQYYKLNKDKPYPFYDRPVLTERFREVINSSRKSKGLLIHPSISRLFSNDKYMEYDAVSDFVKSLDETSDKQPHLSGITYIRHDGDKRDKLLNNVFNDVTQSFDNPPILFNIHGYSYNGLRAFSEALTEKLESHYKSTTTSEKSVYLLPLRSNYRPDKPDNVISTGQAIAQLLSFSQDGLTEDVIDNHPLDDDDSLIGAIDKIRERMHVRPFVLIIDGLRVRDNTISRSVQVIEELMKDDHSYFIVDRLLTPIIQSKEHSISNSNYQNNRIIVTSNVEIKPLIEDAVYPISIIPSDINNYDYGKPVVYELPHLSMDDIDILLETNVRIKSIAPIKRILKFLNVGEPPDDVSLYILDTLIHIIMYFEIDMHAEDAEDAEDAEVIEIELKNILDNNDLKPKSLIDALFLYLEKISSNSNDLNIDEEDKKLIYALCWVEIMIVAAISPEGIRPSTIYMMVDRVGYIPDREKYDLLKCTEQVINKDILYFRKIIEKLIEVAAPCIGLIRTEYNKWEDNKDEKIIYGKHQEDYDYISEKIENTLDYRDKDVRKYVREMAMRKSRKSVFIAHLIYSEICLQLSSILVRHSSSYSRGEIRQWRRVLATIYHGLASIPYKINGEIYEKEEIEYGTRDIMIYGGIEGWWNYLLTRIWYSLLDGGKERRLTRTMGLDSIVLDIYQMFNTPSIITGNTSMKSMFHSRENSTGVKIYTCMNTSYSALNRGETENAFNIVNGFMEKKPNSENTLKELYISAKEYILDKDNLSRYARIIIGIKIEQNELLNKEDIVYIIQDICGEYPFREMEKQVSKIADKLKMIEEIQFKQWNELEREIIDETTRKTKKFVSDSDNTANIINRICEIWWKYYEQSVYASDIVAEGYTSMELIYNGLRISDATKLYNVITSVFGKERFDDREEREKAVYEKRIECMAAYLVTEAFRSESAYHNTLTSGTSGSRRSSTQGRIGIRLALSIDETLSKNKSMTGNTIYKIYARRLADSISRDNWRYPRNQAHALITEAMFILADVNATSETLLRARECIYEAERLISGHNRRTRARLRMILSRSKIHRKLLIITKKGIYKHLCHYDARELNTLISNDNDRPYWQCLVAMEKHSILTAITM